MSVCLKNNLLNRIATGNMEELVKNWSIAEKC